MSATTDKYAFGMIGLGVMGRSLLLNMADHGFAVAGHDKDAGKVASLNEEAGDSRQRLWRCKRIYTKPYYAACHYDAGTCR
jgi:6-phosphogluconate dehydrogenase